METYETPLDPPLVCVCVCRVRRKGEITCSDSWVTMLLHPVLVEHTTYIVHCPPEKAGGQYQVPCAWNDNEFVYRVGRGRNDMCVYFIVVVAANTLLDRG